MQKLEQINKFTEPDEIKTHCINFFFFSNLKLYIPFHIKPREVTLTQARLQETMEHLACPLLNKTNILVIKNKFKVF